MAKLKSIPFKFTAKSGDVLTFSAEVSVLDSSGVFSLTIPDALNDVAWQVHRQHEQGVYRGIEIDRPRTHLRVSANTLELCKSFINHVGRDHMACEVSEEFVLVYDYAEKIAYCRGENSSIYPNGYMADEVGNFYKDGKAAWCGSLNANVCADHFQVGLFARVVKKILYTRPSGVKVEYQRVTDQDAKSRLWMGRLNAFVGLKIRNDYDGMNQVGYTEEAARFFYGMMLSMCQLADRMNNFFGEKSRVTAAIESGSFPALVGPAMVNAHETATT